MAYHFPPTCIRYFSKVLLIPACLPLDLQRFKLFRTWTEPQTVNTCINDITTIIFVWRMQTDNFYRADGFTFFLGHQIQFVGSLRVSYSATESNGHRERERESWHSSCAAFQCDGACAFRGLQLAFYTGERSRFQVEEWETHSTSSCQHVG